MVYPVQFGLPQIVLLLVVLVAVLLLVTAVVEIRVAEEAAEGRRRLRVRRRPRFGRGLGSLVLLALSAFLLWITALIQTFLGLTGEVRAAHVVAAPLGNVDHSMVVDLTLFDDKGNVSSHKSYQVEGDRWMLQADIVELNHWVNVLGMHSGYQITRLFGERTDGVPPTQHQIMLSNDESFFNDMSSKRWWTKPFVRSAYGNAVIAPPGSYDVFISQDAIKTRPA